MSNTDKDWEEWGRQDPYFGVITDEKFRQENIQNSKDVFFKTGEDDVGEMMGIVEKHFAEGFKPKNVLDYGCGVGRLLIPFSKRAAHVTGVDVSEAMLVEAKKNCTQFSLQNVTFFKTDDELSALHGQKFDLINSYIVFQHIPVKRGMVILKNLLKLLAPGGVGVLHFTYGSSQSNLKKFFVWLRMLAPGLYLLMNLKSGRKITEPQMQMHNYPLSKIFKKLQAISDGRIFVKLTQHGEFYGGQLFFKKNNS